MKLFRIMMALMLAFALVVPAAMADDEPDVCEPCTAKCSPKNICCASGDQWGSSCPTGEDCIDCDGNLESPCTLAYEIPALATDGTEDLTSTTLGYSDCPVIIDICECDVIESGAVTLEAGTEIGLKMTLLIDGQAGQAGAYFAESWTGQVLMSNSRAWLCNPAWCTTPDQMVTASVDGGVAVTTSFWCDVLGDNDGLYDLYNEVNATGEPMWRADAFNVVPMSFICPTATTNTSAFISSNNINVENADEVFKMTHMAVDVPNVAITPAITECSTISVRVDIYIGTTTICPTDKAQCSCVFDLYVACCETTENDMVYPYFTSLTSATFWNGIVITNLGTTAGTASLTAYEQDGSVATFTTPEIAGRGMYVNLLENIAWNGTGLGGSRCWIKVETDFDCDGFAMLSNDTHDAMGYLPRFK